MLPNFVGWATSDKNIKENQMRDLNQNEINEVTGAGWINDIGEKLRDYFEDLVGKQDRRPKNLDD